MWDWSLPMKRVRQAWIYDDAAVEAVGYLKWTKTVKDQECICINQRIDLN